MESKNFLTAFGTTLTMFCISYYLLKRTFTINQSIKRNISSGLNRIKSISRSTIRVRNSQAAL